MWLLTGPFDSESGDVSTTKTKLLKTGRKTTLGRKDRPLLVSNKKISRDHCEFTVGPCTQDDVLNPSFVPTLEIYNTKDKPMSIDRDGHAVMVNPSSSCELKSGDKINIVVGISIEVHWRRIACFLPPARSLPSISSDDCATLGISLITSPSSLVTHHLTPKYELNVSLATSLLSAIQLVKVEWLQEFIRLGTTSDDSHPLRLAPLELTFIPPSESKYRPIFSPSLAPLFKTFKFWEPNEERLHLLKGYRFVLLCDAEGQADADTRELIIRGDGEYECFPLTNGEAKWRQMLAKAKRKVDEAGLKVAIVAREQVVKATVGEDKWRGMITEAQSLSLPLVNVDTLMNVVINTDASLINQRFSSQAESESPLPDFVPNTHPNEPSLPVAPERAPTEANDIHRKSQSPSPPPVLFGLPIPPPPSKTLIRRTKPLSTTSRAEEPAVSNTKAETQGQTPEYTLPPLPVMTRSAKLKRRTPAPAPTTSIEEVISRREEREEPPLKKFKALFDASDPDKMIVDPHNLGDAYDMAPGDSVGFTQGGESMTQNDSRPLHSQIAAPQRILDIVAEEEEESGHSPAESTAPALPPAHRKSPLPQEVQESHVDAAQNSRRIGGAPAKRAKSKPPQNHQIDTDPSFLTALASRKGKKKMGEDEFDREFNKLRISKPDIHRDEEDRLGWEILGDFDTDARNLRGNFMVVIDLEVFRRNSDRGDRASAMRTYDGRPNFKKFKKTPTPSSRAPIELVARAEHDYGVGSGYWKGGTSRDQETLASTQTTLGTQKQGAPTVFESDDADSDVPVAKTTKRVTRKAPQLKASAAAGKLFLNSDEEGGSAPVEDFQGTTGKSHTRKIDPASSLPARGSKRRHIIVDDDSDDGVAFKGFGKKRRIR